MKTFAQFLTTIYFFAALMLIASAREASAQAYFDFDRKSDLGVFRPSDGSWYSFSSESNLSSTTRWGLATDRRVPADFDGDGLTDFAVWRPETGTWFVLRSRDGGYDQINWGTRTANPFGTVSDEPVPADYDGDGHADFAVWRPNSGVWFVLTSKTGYKPEYATYFTWGKYGDIPVPADYDGDGSADFAVFRSTENRWYVFQSKTSTWTSTVFGRSGFDQLVPADYTGDDRVDLAVYRNGEWLIRDSATGEDYYFRLGNSTDIPVPADYNGDGLTDLAVFRRGVWYVMETIGGRVQVFNYGSAGDFPVTTGIVKPSIVGVS